MLKGDLAVTPLSEVLRQLADGGATGCLHVLDAAGEQALVFLRGGRVYAVAAPRDQPVVDDDAHGQLRGSLSDLLPWRHATWRFRVNERTREDVAPPVEVEALLGEIEARQDLSTRPGQVLPGPGAVPVLSAADTAADETEIDPDAWSLLCKVDGVRTVVELARECGVTLHQAGRIVARLVAAGLLEVDEPSPERVQGDGLPPREVASRLASALTGPGVPVQREEPGSTPRPPGEEVADSLHRISASLSALLGPATASDDVFSAPVRRPPTVAAPDDPQRTERELRAAARRERDAAELAAAQVELEAARAEQEADKAEQAARFEAEHGQDHVADVVDLSSVRAAAEALAEAEEHRLAQEAHAAEEAEAERARMAEEIRLAEEAEAPRVADARFAEEAELLAEEEHRAGEGAEQARLLEAHLAEQARLAEEATLLAEDARAAEEARESEEAREAEVQRATVEADEQAGLDEEDAVERARVTDELRLEQEHAAAEARQAQEDAARRELDAATARELAALTADLKPAHDAHFDPAGQAAAFAELRASAASTGPAAAPAPGPPAVVAPPAAETQERAHHAPAPSYAHDTDTASLLRELSSLGLDEDAPAQPTPRPGPPRPTSITPAKKRKGLFGR